MKIVYGAFWEEHIQGDTEFQTLLKDAQEKLDHSSKGEGKGEKGKVGAKSPASQN